MKTKAKSGADFRKKLELETGTPLGLSNYMALLLSFSTRFFWLTQSFKVYVLHSFSHVHKPGYCPLVFFQIQRT